MSGIELVHSERVRRELLRRLSFLLPESIYPPHRCSTTPRPRPVGVAYKAPWHDRTHSRHCKFSPCDYRIQLQRAPWPKVQAHIIPFYPIPSHFASSSLISSHLLPSPPMFSQRKSRYSPPVPSSMHNSSMCTVDTAPEGTGTLLCYKGALPVLHSQTPLTDLGQSNRVRSATVIRGFEAMIPVRTWTMAVHRTAWTGTRCSDRRMRWVS